MRISSSAGSFSRVAARCCAVWTKPCRAVPVCPSALAEAAPLCVVRGMGALLDDANLLFESPYPPPISLKGFDVKCQMEMPDVLLGSGHLTSDIVCATPSLQALDLGRRAVAGVLMFAGLYRPFGSLCARRRAFPSCVSLRRVRTNDFRRRARVKELESRLAVLAADRVPCDRWKRKIAPCGRRRDSSTRADTTAWARVISRDVRGTKAVLTIDRGKDDSLEVGRAVGRTRVS